MPAAWFLTSGPMTAQNVEFSVFLCVCVLIFYLPIATMNQITENHESIWLLSNIYSEIHSRHLQVKNGKQE